MVMFGFRFCLIVVMGLSEVMLSHQFQLLKQLQITVDRRQAKTGFHLPGTLVKLTGIEMSLILDKLEEQAALTGYPLPLFAQDLLASLAQFGFLVHTTPN